MTYKELIAMLPTGENPTYEALLNTEEWKLFRDRIIDRIKKCEECGEEMPRKMTPDEFQAAVNLREADRLANPYIYLLDKDTTDPELYERMKIKYNPPALAGFTKGVRLEVHHTYYVKGTLPWEYPEHSLQSLCSDCHHDKHFDSDGNKLKLVKSYTDTSKSVELLHSECDKCGGAGYIPEYRHRDGGVCYKCGGSGIPGIWH